jgi:hypothetical protein
LSFDLLYAIEIVRYYARRVFSFRGVGRAVRPTCDDDART